MEMDLVNTLKWPAVVFFIAVIVIVVFNKAIRNLLARMQTVTYGDKAFDFSGGLVAIQQKETSLPANDRPALSDASLQRTLPPFNDLYAGTENNLVTMLAENNIHSDTERAWILRAYAVERIGRFHESTYRVIFGSQLELLLLANTVVPPTSAQARELYEGARATYPAFYADFPFHTWESFPVHQGLLERVSEKDGAEPVLKLTAMGKDFLHYLISNSLTGKKYG